MDQSKKAPEYQKLMEQAPQIKASGLEGDYRMLAEYNNVVLAGHHTKFGIEFVTWEWVHNHTSLWQGHYYGDNYDAAKQDFVTRSGLIPTGALFTPEELTEVYRSIHETISSCKRKMANILIQFYALIGESCCFSDCSFVSCECCEGRNCIVQSASVICFLFLASTLVVCLLRYAFLHPFI